MKIRELCRFSNAALKSRPSAVQKHILILWVMYLTYALAIVGGYKLASLFSFETVPLLCMCAGVFVMRALLGLVTSGQYTAIISECTSLLILPYGYYYSARKSIRRLYLLRGSVRLILRLAAAAVIIAAVYLIYMGANMDEGIYCLFGALQALPLLFIWLIIKFRTEAIFACSQVICVQEPELSAFSAFISSARMLKGKQGFLLSALLRKLPSLILPVTQPYFAMTAVTLFSVRRLEWKYEQKGAEQKTEQIGIYRRHRKTHEAGGLSPA